MGSCKDVFIPTGISFVRPVDGSYCRACKKFIVTSIEEHCRSKEHYDKFVDVVNGKKVKAFEIEANKTIKQEDDKAGDKRKVDEEGDDEDDSGNWKRQKKNKF